MKSPKDKLHRGRRLGKNQIERGPNEKPKKGEKSVVGTSRQRENETDEKNLRDSGRPAAGRDVTRLKKANRFKKKKEEKK